MKEKSKTLIVKGVPTEFTNDVFKETFDSNKMQYTKAERMKIYNCQNFEHSA